MKILIINGPNLNIIGKREPEIYGGSSLEEYLRNIACDYSPKGIEINSVQSNIEGEIVTFIQKADGAYDGIILNAGGYSHTSIVIADAVRAVSIPTTEVHISNIFAREDYRHHSITGAACRGSISGFGLDSYRLAIESLLETH